ncbi:dTDP-4-dehydrorhamnose 3,5-epimerase family protein [Aeromonas sp.]|uniref:dTDP-4-dehydrorhamnose 3,5-epimerase family protein n=1 Tax=Aeromonas sp. TaxID=647 RepID=UPI00258E9D35|nr:dTDP-4-dehydrorhamnose 3,5-epimerase family protein [Aeromonas sp.]MCX7132360.1 dTDP-4-dehydrorhamnose 3,5-epimerase family protein [Aeromonas sp.]
MSRFALTSLPLSGLKLIQRQSLGDERGYFSRLFCANELAAAGWHKPIAQVNHTYTAKRGTVRGLHFQHSPHVEMKLVSCLQGEIWDLVVDLRQDSPTFLCWHAEILSAGNNCSLLIPEGFAHGFQTLSDEVALLYCHSAFYSPEAESGLNIFDPRLAIDLPLPLGDCSARDQAFPFIDDTYFGVFNP